MRDDELILKAQAGEVHAFEQLYHSYVHKVHAQLVRIVGRQADDIEDLIQLVFIQVHKAIREYRFDAHFWTWMHRIVINVALQSLRKKKRVLEESLPLEDYPVTHDLFESVAAKLEIQRFESALRKIHPKKQVAFVLYHVEGLSLEEIAKLMGSQKTTVSERIRSARKEIRSLLDQDILKELSNERMQ